LPEAEANLTETLEKGLGFLTRRRWWILFPACGTTLSTIFVLSLLPTRFTSEATLLVVQQQVPERYVSPTSTTNIRQALMATTEEVLSRTRLLQIIDEFRLYPKKRERLGPEGLMELMRSDIDIKPLETNSERDINGFKISFIAENPQLAQEVTSRLTSLFIEENLKTREHQATTTTKFLQEQLEVAKTKLAEAEEQVRSFKMQHLGELPEQQQGNLTILSGLQARLQNVMSSLSRAEQQREYLQSMSGSRALAVDSDLARLKSERASLLSHYTSQYPAVMKVDEKIAQTEALLKDLRPSAAPGTEKAQTQSPQPPSVVTEQSSSIALLRSQLEANRLEIEYLSREEKQLKSSVDQYQERLNQTPVREQQLAGILRNYDLLKQDYGDLLNKQLQSQLAANLEKRQEGQQFRLIDRPSLPTVPSSPNRPKVSLGGVAAGVFLGLVLAFLVEGRDRSFRSERDLSHRFALPLVVGVPLLLTPAEQRVQAWKNKFEWVAGSTFVLAVFIAEFYELYVSRRG
jgi:succinoglycan biosynthesis transport protein ExoP